MHPPQAMIFVHHSRLQFHGRFTSHAVLLDSRLVVKITDYGMMKFKFNLPMQWWFDKKYYMLKWTPPEVLRELDLSLLETKQIQMADIYAYGIILSGEDTGFGFRGF